MIGCGMLLMYSRWSIFSNIVLEREAFLSANKVSNYGFSYLELKLIATYVL